MEWNIIDSYRTTNKQISSIEQVELWKITKCNFMIFHPQENGCYHAAYNFVIDVGQEEFYR